MKLELFLRHLENPQIYYPQLAKVTGGVTASILFLQVFYWQSQLANSQTWVKVTIEDIELETGLSTIEQEVARCQLLERFLLKEKLLSSNILELWVDIDAFEGKLNHIFLAKSSDTIVKNRGEIKHHPVEIVNQSSTSNFTIKTDKFFGQPRQQTIVKVTPNYKFNGPWQCDEQFEEFQRTLLEYFKMQGFTYPSRCVFYEIDNMTKGIISPLWDDFISGNPLGSSQKVKRDWEIEAGVPYPAFEEERIQYYIHKGEPLEQAVLKARSDLRNPVLGRDLWEGFLRKCDRIADDAIKAKNLGIETPYLPPSFTDKPQITKESVIKKLGIIAPQFSLESSNSNMLLEETLSQQEIKEQASLSVDEIPSIASLQDACKTPIGRNMIENLIAKNPNWGYEMVDGEVIESIPF
ncbi:hypothetical protein BCD67_18745 [Oscillatoriales cyanobacterium USR001]|nr:hypothetical protein BCD67_18745 [Oscillatoriales cyanobacterium USR001]